jgi:alpha-galactosidase
MVGGFRNWHVGNDQDHFTFAKFLANGDIAIGMFNLSDDPANLFFHLTELGLTRGCGVKLAMKELWSGEETESRDGMFTTTIGKHDCRIYRCRLVKDGE